MALPWRQFALFFIIEMRAKERTLQSIRQGPLLLLYAEATGDNLWETKFQTEIYWCENSVNVQIKRWQECLPDASFNSPLYVLITRTSLFTFQVICKSKKENVRPTTVCEGPDGEYRFRSTDMRCLTTGIRSEICVARRFRRCANVIECTYTNLDSTV